MAYSNAFVLTKEAGSGRLALRLGVDCAALGAVQPRYFAYLGTSRTFAPTHVLDALMQLEDLQPLLPHLPDLVAGVRALRPRLAERAARIDSATVPITEAFAQKLIADLAAAKLGADADEILIALRNHVLLRLAQISLGEVPQVQLRQHANFLELYLLMLKHLHGAWRALLREELRPDLDVDQHMLAIRRVPIARSGADNTARRLALVAFAPEPGLIPHLPIMEGAYWLARLAQPVLPAHSKSLTIGPGGRA